MTDFPRETFRQRQERDRLWDRLDQEERPIASPWTQAWTCAPLGLWLVIAWFLPTLWAMGLGLLAMVMTGGLHQWVQSQKPRVPRQALDEQALDAKEDPRSPQDREDAQAISEALAQQALTQQTVPQSSSSHAKPPAP